MKKRLKVFDKLSKALAEKKITRFRQCKIGKRWLYSASVLVALTGGVAIVSTTHPELIAHIVHALTLPPGSNQIGSIGSAPVIQTNNNSFSSMQPLFDSLIGTQQPEYIAGDTIDGSGGQNVGWHSGTTYAGTSITDANSQLNEANGLSYWTIHYGLKANDGFQDGDKFNYVMQGQTIQVKNVGTAYNTSTKQNVPISMEVKINSATYYDSPTSTTPRDVFGDGYRLLVAARNNNGNITLGYMVSMDGIPNPGTGQGSEGGGGNGSGGDTLGAASGIPRSVSITVTLYDENTKQTLPSNTLAAMKVSDIDAGQAAQLAQNNQLGYIISKPTNLEINNNVLTAKGNNTVVDDSQSLNSNSYVALYTGNSTFINFDNTNGNQKQGSIVQALFGNMGSTSPRQPLGYIAINKSTLQYGTSFPNNLYNFKDLSFQVIDKDKKVIDTVKLDDLGNGKSKGLPAGDYILHEISGQWASTGQTVRPDQIVTVEAGETTTVAPKNTAVTGQITIIKKGKESGNDLWNDNYTLEGNKFKLTSLTDSRTYTATTDKDGKAIVKDLPLGKYKVEETVSSDGFANTFQPVEVEIKYKDQNTTVVFGTANSENQEIKGQNKLQKSDKETGVDQDGKAVMKDAKYGWFHDDISTGSSPHKVGDPVKWTEKPNPQLLTGDKVSSAVIGGIPTEFGDNVVIKVSDDKFEAAVGNLASGRYYVQELDAGEGYTTDPTKHKFEIKKKDDQTQIIVTDDSKSEEQVIKARITLNKMVTLPGNQGGSGYNGVEFTASPLEGTKAEEVLFTTGVNPNTGDDGWTQQDLVYGDWKIEETKGVEGYENVRPVYVHMITDREKDVLEISASYNEDFSQPFSKRTFSLKDSSTSSNPNGDSTVGEVTSDVPTISLSTLHFNDNPDEKPKPEITTTATDKADGDKTLGVGYAQIKDKVIGENFSVNQILILESQPVSKATGKPLLDKEGQSTLVVQDVTSDAQGNFLVDVFSKVLDTTGLQEEEVTLLTKIKRQDGKVLAEDNNYKNNPDETVRVDKAEGHTEVQDKEVKPELTTVTDRFYYEGLVKGDTYTVTVKQAYEHDLKKEIDVEGQLTFEAEDTSGTVDIPVQVDGTKYAGHTLTFYADAYHGKDLEGEPVISHHDKDDEKETFKVELPPEEPKEPKEEPEKPKEVLPLTGEVGVILRFMGLGVLLAGFALYKRELLKAWFTRLKK